MEASLCPQLPRLLQAALATGHWQAPMSQSLHIASRSHLVANSLGAEVAMFLGLIDWGVDLLVVALLLPLLKAAPSPTNLNR